MVYYFWLKNNENYYERIKTITDVLSSIGGVSNAIFFIVSFINKIITQKRFNKNIA